MIQLISAAKSDNKGEMDTWAEENLRMLDNVASQLGYPPVSPSVRQEVLGMSLTGDDAAGLLTEEIATIRLLLRNVYFRACQGGEDRQLLHLVNLYGLGCVRLARLEKLCGSCESGALAYYMKVGLDQAIREVFWELHQGEIAIKLLEPGL